MGKGGGRSALKCKKQQGNWEAAVNEVAAWEGN